jgi:subtilisin family serine protease
VKETLLTGRKDSPRQVEPDVIYPEVEDLGPAVRPPREVGLALARGVVQGDAVEVCDAGDDAQGVSPGTVPRDGDCVGEAEGSPDELYMCRLVSVAYPES